MPEIARNLQAALCNAPGTIDSYYAFLVNLDLYGEKINWQLIELPVLLKTLRFIFNSKLNADKQKK